MDSKHFPNQYVCECEHIILAAIANTVGKIGAIFKIDCGELKECTNQPERSKREDS